MKISDKGIKLIKEFEGLRLEAYKCPAGVWTIGYGHTKGVMEGDKITGTEADSFLRSDVASSERTVSAYEGLYHFNQDQFDALTSFAFNCGSGNFRKLIDNGRRDLKTIGDKILLYNKAGGKTLPGLDRRRKAERDLFLGRR